MSILRALINSLAVTPTATGTTPTLSSLQILLSDGTYATGTQVQTALGVTNGGGGPSYATAFSSTLSASTGATGTAVTLTLTPGTGGWPAVVVTPSSTLAGTFSPTSRTPTAGSTAALTFAFTPSAAGTGTVTASASGMTAGTAPSYTATAQAASNVNTSYTARNTSGNAWPATMTFASGDNYLPFTGFSMILDGSGNGPASVVIAVGSSSTTPPVSGAAGGDYGLNNSDNQSGYFVNGYGWRPSGGMYLWRNGHAVGTISTRFLWFQLPDATWVLLTNTDGTPYAVTVNY